MAPPVSHASADLAAVTRAAVGERDGVGVEGVMGSVGQPAACHTATHSSAQQ